MLPLEKNQFDGLDASALASRIDEFFLEDYIRRYGADVPRWNVVTATDILSSRSVQKLSEKDKRCALLLFYRTVFQSVLCEQYAGIENHLIHRHEGEAKWSNPHVQIQNAATRQAEVIAARISFECLMEFVYFVEKGDLITAKKSKLKKFREWCCEKENRFGWLIFYLFVIYRFDREHRSPEVHGTSYMAIDALRCNVWPRVDSERDAMALNLNIWRSILETLNGEMVHSCLLWPREEAVFKDYFFKWQELDLAALWEKWANNI